MLLIKQRLQSNIETFLLFILAVICILTPFIDHIFGIEAAASWLGIEAQHIDSEKQFFVIKLLLEIILIYLGLGGILLFLERWFILQKIPQYNIENSQLNAIMAPLIFKFKELKNPQNICCKMIKSDVDQLCTMVADMSRDIVIASEYYKRYLLIAYREADSVLATSVEDYFTHCWDNQNLGHEVKVANRRKKNSSIRTTRIFVFNSIKSVTEHHEKEMKDQKEEYGINIYLYFESEKDRQLQKKIVEMDMDDRSNETIKYIMGYKDLAIINKGEVVAVTSSQLNSAGKRNLRATWYLGGQANSINKNLVKFGDEMLSLSISYDDYVKEKLGPSAGYLVASAPAAAITTDKADPDDPCCFW